MSARWRMPAPRPRPAAGRMMSTAEVAAIFRVSPKTVCRWAWEGRLESRQASKNASQMFYAEDIEAFLNGSRP